VAAETFEAIAGVDEVSVNEDIRRAIAAHIEARPRDADFRRPHQYSMERNKRSSSAWRGDRAYLELADYLLIAGRVLRHRSRQSRTSIGSSSNDGRPATGAGADDQLAGRPGIFSSGGLGRVTVSVRGPPWRASSSDPVVCRERFG